MEGMRNDMVNFGISELVPVKVTNVQREIIKTKSRWFLLAEDALPLAERSA
ncbi:hypothetical protein H8S51_013685 [Roseburia rectibacter]|uniref:hypothetical protein n=1 Tax=Roseburia TaxID=841 RepID=UPI0013150254|nr:MULTISPECIES: hypothetical protein [Roseburia]UMY99349.1 hypothetical protein H8S51_013685 [Roseburia rectibacter]